jgi:SsrA-binding protein
LLVAEGEHTVISNRRARHEYHIMERFEAGIELVGTEVKSLREGKGVLRDAFATERGGELWLVGATIEHYDKGNRQNHEIARDRKLLLRRREIDRLAQRIAEKGLTVVPLRIYFKNGRAKVELGLARGKEGVDKRVAMQERDVKREIQRELKARSA